MLVPLRSVMAMAPQHCKMDAMSTHEMATMSSAEMKSHQHSTAATADIKHKCCCCDDGKCAGNCDLGMSISLLVQESLYAPFIVAVTASVINASAILIRPLTPLPRPPATLS